MVRTPDQIGGYRVLRLLGEGGQGTVYLAKDAAGHQVAVKVLLPEVVADAVARSRIAAEAELARRVPSFCTARLLDACFDGDQPYLVTEFVPGLSLAEHVRLQGPLRGSELERLMVSTLTALTTIHRAGVVHHDLKPANILLGPDGPRVVDFGIALRAGAVDPQANADGVLGSAAFLAPERLDAGPATPASDVFGWAASMVHAATARSPFQAPTQTGVLRAVEHKPPQLDGVPGALHPLLAGCLGKDPARRPTAGAALSLLLEALQPQAVNPQAVNPQPAGLPLWGTPGAGPAPRTLPVPGRRSAPRAVARLRPTVPSVPSAGAVVSGVAALGLLLLGLGVVLASGSAEQPTALDGPAAQPGPAWAPAVAAGPHSVEVVDLDRRVLTVLQPAATGVLDDASRSERPLPGARRVTSTEGDVVALSGDGRRVAVLSAAGKPGTGTIEGTVTVLDATAMQPVAVPLAVTGPVTGHSTIQLSGDGTVVVAALGVTGPGAAGAGRVSAWRVADGKPLLDLTPGAVRGDLTVSWDGTWAAFRVTDGHGADQTRGRFRLVRLALAAADRTAVDLPGECQGGLAVDAPRRHVFCQLAGRVQVLGLDGRPAGAADVTGAADQPDLVQVSPDGTRLLQASPGSGKIRVIGTDGSALLTEAFPDSTTVTAAAFSADGRRIAAVGGQHVVTYELLSQPDR